MRRAAALIALALAAGCGGGSGELAVPPPHETPPRLAQPTLPVLPPQPVPSTPSGRPSADGSAGTGGGTATAGSVTAGSATSGPGRLSSPATTPSPRPTPSAVGGTVTVTDAESGATVRLVVGQHLRVRLGHGTWDPPASSDTNVVVRRSSTGGYPSDQPVDAMFDAIARGSADITAQSDAACFHTEPRCLMASREWQVHVIVR